MGMQGEPNGRWLTRTFTQSCRPPTPLDGAYCNALVHAACPLGSSSKAKPCQFSSVTSLWRRFKTEDQPS